MTLLEEHRTPDGLYLLIVERSDDGVISLGFAGFPSHTHGDILAELTGLSMDAAVRAYIEALLSGRSFLGVATVAGKVQDVWVTDDPRPDRFKPDNETIEFRKWDGQPAA